MHSCRGLSSDDDAIVRFRLFSLPPEARRLYSRSHGGVLPVPRPHRSPGQTIVEFLRVLGELDDALIMVVSDNGASAEGGPATAATRRTSPSTTPRSRWRRASPLIEIWISSSPRTFDRYPWGWTWAGTRVPSAVRSGRKLLPGRRQRSVSSSRPRDRGRGQVARRSLRATEATRFESRATCCAPDTSSVTVDVTSARTSAT